MAAFDGPQMCYPGVTAGADLSAAGNKFKFVKFTANKVVGLCAAVTDLPCGVLQNNPANGAEATVCFFGITKVQADADLAFSNQIGTSADGQAAAYTVADTTKFIVGRVISDEGQSAAGGLVTAVIDCANPRVLA